LSDIAMDLVTKKQVSISIPFDRDLDFIYEWAGIRGMAAKMDLQHQV